MKQVQRSNFYLWWLFFLISCSPKDCLKSTGSIRKEFRAVPFFNKLYTYDNISIVLQENDSLFVEAGENLLEKIILEVREDSSLHIRNQNTCNFTRNYNTPVRVYVGVKNLFYIKWQSFGNLESNGKIHFSHLQMDFTETNPKISLEVQSLGLYLFSNAGAEFSLKGKTDFFSFYHLGYGKVNASEMLSKNATIINEGQNHIWVRTSDTLKAEIRSSGNIILSQIPQRQEVKITGTGKIVVQP
ncbi:GIN domain-containing protein [Raineya orbicola]|jgi:hypothetical protein|uniref:Putative auto-transporter adhesin head GIN domain-containing protein n=1 Tax=Raineya orbicola TaxID=2016530 RepID=A0A2N3I8F4_9BACT|nr:DUF2807 domain-containing protein [Raineya orbicola]PKQ66575.1 hypothetical protein Rain11_2333 [Raineya orbicola]